ncbi:MAG: MFS transporter, partial [Gemmatimonadaceae bacterium]
MNGLPRFRWVVCALLFFATTINYIDRQVLGILAVPLQRDLGWSESEYGYIVTAFQAAYALGMLVSGRVLDRIGTRIGYAVGITVWSLAAMATGLMNSARSFGAARFALGLGEAANFPAAIKTTAEWFPARERAFATGLLNSGTNIGAVLAPLIVPAIALRWGWRWAFYLTGAIGFVWLVVWLLVYRKPSPTREPALFESTADAATQGTPVSWRMLLGMKETWALGFGRFCADPIWWFYLYWTPKFLDARHGVTLAQLAAPLVAIYLVADVGSILGGYISS